MSTNEESAQSTRAGVIGLGIMGGAFARHLAAAGVRTSGYDLLPANLDAFSAHGGHACSSARAVAAMADIVITSLPHSAALENALFGEEGLVAAGRPDLLVVETSTLALEDKERARGRLAAAGIGMLDAPISGTGPQAQPKILRFSPAAIAPISSARAMCSPTSPARFDMLVPSAQARK